MTPKEYRIWSKEQIEYTNKENEQIDYRLAVLLSHMTNLKISKKSKMTKPEDFMKKRKKKNGDKKPMSPLMMAEILKGYTLASGGIIKE
jgi:hypothetical protein